MNADEVFDALDGARRAGWAKFYQSQLEVEELTGRIEDLERGIVNGLAYWIDQSDSPNVFYWANMVNFGLYDQALERMTRQAAWDGVLPDGSRSPFPEIAQRLLDAEPQRQVHA